MNNIVKFQEKELNTYDLNGQVALSSVDLAKGLGYADESAVTRIYNRHADEFTTDMTQTVNLTVKGFGNGNSVKPVRIFSSRGCYLVAMFAKTPFAKAFRKWVLDVLDKKPTVHSLTQDREALKAIGGIVKKCTVVSVRDAIMDIITAAEQPNFFGEVSDQDLVKTIWGWYASHHKKTFDALREVMAENEKLHQKLRMVQQALN